MNFDVIWSPKAFRSIDVIYEASKDRKQLTEAIRRLGQDLASDPGTKGESRPTGHRIVFSPPLGAVFQIHWRLNQVVIGDVWNFER